jgi:hypothetical protein
MPEDGDVLISGWIAGVKAGDLSAAQPLWERYFARMVELARARHRIGQSAEARRTLERLRELMKAPPSPGQEEAKALLDQATALIERPSPSSP